MLVAAPRRGGARGCRDIAAAARRASSVSCLHGSGLVGLAGPSGFEIAAGCLTNRLVEQIDSGNSGILTVELLDLIGKALQARIVSQLAVIGLPISGVPYLNLRKLDGLLHLATGAFGVKLTDASGGLMRRQHRDLLEHRLFFAALLLGKLLRGRAAWLLLLPLERIKALPQIAVFASDIVPPGGTTRRPYMPRRPGFSGPFFFSFASGVGSFPLRSAIAVIGAVFRRPGIGLVVSNEILFGLRAIVERLRHRS